MKSAVETTSAQSDISQWNVHDGVYRNYDEFVYSIMATKQKQQHILDHMEDEGNVLIVGGGPTAYLEKAILETKQNVFLVTSDFDETMMDQSQEKFTHPRLDHQVADMTQLPPDFFQRFDRVISTNSLVLPTREQTQNAYYEIAKVLKNGGSFLAFLPSFEFIQEIYKNYPRLRNLLDSLMDLDRARFSDTNGFQSFHTEELIQQEIGAAGLQIQSLQKIGVESPEEFQQLVKVYSILAGNVTREIMRQFWEFFVIAEKNPSIPEIQIKSSRYQLSVLDQENITPENIIEVADFYRDIFDNLNAQHFLVDPETFEFKSPLDVFDTSQADDFGWVDRFTRDSLPDQKLPLSSQGNQMIRWHDPMQTREIFEEKYRKHPLIFLLRDENTDQIKGALSFFQSSLRDVFEKSWKDPLEYSQCAGQKPEQMRSFDEFFACVPAHCDQITPDTETMCLDFMALTPQAQKDKKIISLLVAAIEKFSQGKEDLCLIAESKVGAPSHRLLKKRCQFQPLSGFFTNGAKEKEGDDVLEITTVKNFCEGLQFLTRKQ